MRTYWNGPFDPRGKVAVVFGATDETGGAVAGGRCRAGSFITGARLPVGGGYSAGTI